MRNTHLFKTIFIGMIVAFLVSCTSTASNKSADSVEYIETNSSDTLVELGDYKVVLTVDSLIHLHKKGVLKIWIGNTDESVIVEDGTVSDQSTIPKRLGNFARVTTYANGFEVTNPSGKECHEIDPSGSVIRFFLEPLEKGVHNVSADIHLYKNGSCEGASVSKESKTLSVRVVVDKKRKSDKRINELKEIAWDKFIVFWGALITLILSALFFIIRRRIKRKTGYDHKDKQDDESSISP